MFLQYLRTPRSTVHIWDIVNGELAALTTTISSSWRRRKCVVCRMGDINTSWNGERTEQHGGYSREAHIAVNIDQKLCVKCTYVVIVTEHPRPAHKIADWGLGNMRTEQSRRRTHEKIVGTRPSQLCNLAI